MAAPSTSIDATDVPPTWAARKRQYAPASTGGSSAQAMDAHCVPLTSVCSNSPAKKRARNAPSSSSLPQNPYLHNAIGSAKSANTNSLSTTCSQAEPKTKRTLSFDIKSKPSDRKLLLDGETIHLSPTSFTRDVWDVSPLQRKEHVRKKEANNTMLSEACLKSVLFRCGVKGMEKLDALPKKKGDESEGGGSHCCREDLVEAGLTNDELRGLINIHCPEKMKAVLGVDKAGLLKMAVGISGRIGWF